MIYSVATVLLPLRLCVWWQSARGCVSAVGSVQVEAEARLAGCEILTPDYKLVPPGKVIKKTEESRV